LLSFILQLGCKFLFSRSSFLSPRRKGNGGNRGIPEEFLGKGRNREGYRLDESIRPPRKGRGKGKE